MWKDLIESDQILQDCMVADIHTQMERKYVATVAVVYNPCVGAREGSEYRNSWRELLRATREGIPTATGYIRSTDFDPSRLIVAGDLNPDMIHGVEAEAQIRRYLEKMGMNQHYFQRNSSPTHCGGRILDAILLP